MVKKRCLCICSISSAVDSLKLGVEAKVESCWQGSATANVLAVPGKYHIYKFAKLSTNLPSLAHSLKQYIASGQHQTQVQKIQSSPVEKSLMPGEAETLITQRKAEAARWFLSLFWQVLISARVGSGCSKHLKPVNDCCRLELHKAISNPSLCIANKGSEGQGDGYCSGLMAFCMVKLSRSLQRPGVEARL